MTPFGEAKSAIFEKKYLPPAWIYNTQVTYNLRNWQTTFLKLNWVQVLISFCPWFFSWSSSLFSYLNCIRMFCTS